MESAPSASPDTGQDEVLRAIPVSEVDRSGGSALRRAVVDAYDRLSDRVLHRLRAVGEEIEADLGELRTEVASLRQAIEDLGDRVQLRQIRSSMDSLRTEFSGLRRSVMEWPELEQVSADISALRSEVTDLSARTASREGTGSDPVTAELAALREELVLLRRRIALRAEGSDAVALTDEQVQRIAIAVAAELAPPPGTRRPR